MSNEMIERVANSLISEMRKQGLCITKINNSPAKNYSVVAKAAIEAMKVEPGNNIPQYILNQYMNYAPNNPAGSSMWNNCISAALKETK